MRVDSYRGCSHQCRECFSRQTHDGAAIRPGESARALRTWLDGARTQETNWCDWNIPIHWGGLSDPFQPAERERRLSLACLELFAKYAYPVVVSTKATLLVKNS